MPPTQGRGYGTRDFVAFEDRSRSLDSTATTHATHIVVNPDDIPPRTSATGIVRGVARFRIAPLSTGSVLIQQRAATAMALHPIQRQTETHGMGSPFHLVHQRSLSRETEDQWRAN
jgi:hypothetical protein